MSPAKGEGTYNVVVIGGGTAGLVTAAATAALGGRVALVERGRMGGDCLNTGCVPSKALISSARLAAQIRRAPEWGLDPMEPRFDLGRVLESMRERRARIAPHDSQERFESLGVDVVRAHARFLSPHEVQAGGLRLRARNFVIATGSRPAIPPIEGLAGAGPHTSETIFDDLRERPDSLLVLGGGPIGCELGQAFARLGVAVTIVQRAARILEKEDEDAAAVVRRRMEADGVRVLTAAQARAVSRQGARVRVAVQTGEGREETLEAAALLVAAGRAPNTGDLGLDAAGVAHDAKGIRVDACLRTSRPHIYAATISRMWPTSTRAPSSATSCCRGRRRGRSRPSCPGAPTPRPRWRTSGSTRRRPAPGGSPTTCGPARSATWTAPWSSVRKRAS